MKDFRIPLYLLALDGFATVLAILGLLGWREVNIGLPVLARIWPFLIVLGIALMAPMVVRAIKLVRGRG